MLKIRSPRSIPSTRKLPGHAIVIEPLESRIAPASASFNIITGVLTVSMSGSGDSVSVSSADSTGHNIQIGPSTFFNVSKVVIAYTAGNQSVTTSGSFNLTGGFATTVSDAFTNDNLTDTTGGNTFDYSGFGSLRVALSPIGTLSAPANNPDTLVVTNPGATTFSVSLANGQFSGTIGSDSTDFNLANVTNATLTTGGGGAFNVGGWTHNLVLSAGNSTVTAMAASSFTLTNSSLAGSDGLNVALSPGAISSASLTDTAGGNTFDISGYTSTVSVGNSGGASDTIVATKSGGFTLTDTSLFDTRDSMHVQIGLGVRIANLTDTIGSQTFNVTGWSGSGTLTDSFTHAASDSIIAVKSGTITLSDTSLSDTGDGMSLNLSSAGSGIRFANLTETLGGNTFIVSGWTGSADLANSSINGVPDTILATKSANFTLSNTTLFSSDGMALLLSQGGSGIQTANLSDPTGGHTFGITAWTYVANLADSGAADTLSVVKAAGFTLTNTRLTDTADGLQVNYAAGAIQTADLEDTAGGNVFVVDGWTHGGELLDVGAVSDTVAAKKAGGFSLTNTSLSDTADGMSMTLVSGQIQTANLTDTAGGHNFDFGVGILGWTYTANLTAFNTSDSISVAKGGGFTLSDGMLTDTADNMVIKYLPGEIETANLTDTLGGHAFIVDDWTSNATLTNEGAFTDTISASKPGGFTLTNTSLTDGSDLMNVTLVQTGPGIHNANLTDMSGGNNNTFSGWTHVANLADWGQSDSIMAEQGGGFTLSDTQVTSTNGMLIRSAAGAVQFAFLIDTAGAQSFMVDHWSYAAVLTDQGTATDSVSVSKPGGFTLSDASITDTADAMKLTLSAFGQGIHQANLTDTAGGNAFDVGGWTFAASLSNLGGFTDTIVATKAGGFTLGDTSLVTPDGMAITLSQGGNGFHIANLTDTAGGNTFAVDAWTHGGTLVNSGATPDIISAVKAGGFTLTDLSLSDSADTMNLVLSQAGGGIQTANLTDTAGGNVFAFSSGGNTWTHTANLTDSGSSDSVSASKSAGFTLNDTSLAATDGMNVQFAAGAIQKASLTDTGGGHAFNVTGWSYSGSLASLGASDSVTYTDTITNDDRPIIEIGKTKKGAMKFTNFFSIGVVLTDHLLYSTNQMSLALSNIGSANLTAGSGSDAVLGDEVLDASQYTGTLSLTGSAGTIGTNHDILVAGLGANTLVGGVQADRFVLTGFSISDDLTPSVDSTNGVAGERDLIDYSARTYASHYTGFKKVGVTIDLGAIGTVQDVNAASKDSNLKTEGVLTLEGLFDDIEGSEYNDRITGDNLVNVIFGDGGADRLAGGGVPKHVPGKLANHDTIHYSGRSPFAAILPILVPSSIFEAIGGNGIVDPFVGVLDG